MSKTRPMRLVCLFAGLVLALPAGAVGTLVFENTTAEPNPVIELNGAVNAVDDTTAEGGAGSLVVASNDDDLACGGAGLNASQTGGLALLQINLPTTGTLTYYVDADFAYDGSRDELAIQPHDQVTFDVSCFSSFIFSDGFQ